MFFRQQEKGVSSFSPLLEFEQNKNSLLHVMLALMLARPRFICLEYNTIVWKTRRSSFIILITYKRTAASTVDVDP